MNRKTHTPNPAVTAIAMRVLQERQLAWLSLSLQQAGCEPTRHNLYVLVGALQRLRDLPEAYDIADVAAEIRRQLEYPNYYEDIKAVRRY